MFTPLVRMQPLPPYVKPARIILHEHQLSVLQIVINILTHFLCYTDTSITGSGKTMLAMAIAQIFGLILFVVAPAGVKEVWEEHASKYGMVLYFISYESLQGKNNIWVTRYDNPSGKGTEKVKYEASITFRNLVQSKILLIFDECQFAKNPKANKTKACHALSKAIHQANNGSRIGLLSRTPWDREIYLESGLKLMSIITADKLYEKKFSNLTLQGYGFWEAYTWAYSMDPEEAKKLYPPGAVPKAKDIKLAIYNMYVGIIKKKLTISMPNPKFDVKFIGTIKKYELPAAELTQLQTAIKAIKEVINYMPDGTCRRQFSGLDQLRYNLQMMEMSILRLYCQIAWHQLTIDPNSRFAIGVWYNSSVDYFMKNLAMFNPLRLDGQVKPEIRAAYIREFQKPDNFHRLIICKPTAAGTGISCHDVHGGRFTYAVCNPGYNVTSVQQWFGRFYRVGVKSDVHAALIQIENADIQGVMDALARRTDIIKQCVADTFELEADTEDEDAELGSNTFIPFIKDWPVDPVVYKSPI